MFGTVHWAASGFTLTPAVLLFAGILATAGGFSSYASFRSSKKHLRMPSAELAQLAKERRREAAATVNLTLLFTAALIFLTLTGLSTWMDFRVTLPKIAYPTLLLNVLFLPTMAGELLINPLTVHFTHRLDAPWAAVILSQLPALLQLMVTF